MRTIAISSGHGKFVRGATPPYMDEVTEARRVVAEVAKELTALGATVRGPFNDNVSSSQNENLNRIVSWHNNQQRDVDVSVHFNANQQTNSPMGTEVWYLTQKQLAAELSKAMAEAGGFKDRGAKYSDSLYFLAHTAKPSVLLEVCFVDSSADRDLFNKNFSKICRSIAQVLAGAQDQPEEPPVEPELPPELPPAQPEDHPDLEEGDSGPAVASVQRSLGLPDDGDFGPVTDAGVKGFQRAWAVPGGADGLVSTHTWEALEILDQRMSMGSSGLSKELETNIEAIVSDSPVRDYDWEDRGEATTGYYVGMAKTFALAMLMLDEGHPAAMIMSQADTGNPDTDALSWYEDEFTGEEMDNSESGPDTMRHLFVLMVGLGMRESSGNHWEGRDMSADNTSSDEAEAGLFQSSWNLEYASDAIMELFKEFKADPNGFRPDFTKGLYPTTANLDNYGSGDGVYYQWLAKFCPAFAVLMTGVGLRKLRQHWGPINRHEVELVTAVEDMLIDVQRLVEETELA